MPSSLEEMQMQSLVDAVVLSVAPSLKSPNSTAPVSFPIGHLLSPSCIDILPPPSTLKHPNMHRPITPASSPSSDSQSGSDSASADDGNEGPCPSPGGKLKRPRKDRQRTLRVADEEQRPYKRVRIAQSRLQNNLHADVDVDNVVDIDIENVRLSEARDVSAEDVKEKDERALEEVCTPTRENTPAHMSVSPSPFSRPLPPRFQSTSSLSTLSSGSPFPTTPPSNGSPSASRSFSPNYAPPPGPQPFWFEDGDLVLLISGPTTSMSSYTGGYLSPSFPNMSSTPSVGYTNRQEGTSSLQTSAFRIHATRLALASSSFASLLSSPLPTNPSKDDSARAAREIAMQLNSNARRKRGLDADGEEAERKYEEAAGCPMIRLEGDVPRDWVIALEAIYEPLSFQVRPVVFDALASALRISTRYGVRTLREWALAQLRTTWPVHIERMAPIALPYAADAIALARECDVPDILPAAFYALSVQRWRPSPVHTPSAGSVSASASMRLASPPTFRSVNPTTSNAGFGLETGGTDGGRAHAVLDPMDLRRLVAGREALQDVLVEIVADPLGVGRCMWDPPPGACDASPGGGGMYVGESPEPELELGPKTPPALVGNEAEAVEAPSSPAFSNVSGTTEGAMVTVCESGGSSGGGMDLGVPFHQPTPHPFLSFSSFTSSPSSSSSSSFSSSSTTAFTSTSTTSFATSTTCSPPAPNFTFCPATGERGCRRELESLWRGRLVPDGRRAWGTWLARELYRLATLPRYASSVPGSGTCSGSGSVMGCQSSMQSEKSSDVVGGGAGDGKVKKEEETKEGETKGEGERGCCAKCWEENRRLALWRLDWLCAAIPGMFML